MKSSRKKNGKRKPVRRLHRKAKPAARSVAARRKAILVLGMHRSGASALARVLGLLGADLPLKFMNAGLGDETGHWESVDLVAIHDELLSSAGSKWDDWRPFSPDWDASQVATSYKQRLVETIERNWPASSLFVVEDPRICRFVPVWLDVLDRISAEPHVIIPVRNPLEVATSLKQRDGLLPAKSYLLWLRHVLDAEFTTRNLPRALMTYEGLLADWKTTVAQIAEQAELRWRRRSDFSELKIDKFIATTLRHYSVNSEGLNARSEIANWIRDVYDILLRMANGGEKRDHLARLNQVRIDFDKASQAFGRVLNENDEVTQLRGSEGKQWWAQLAKREEESARLHAEMQTPRASLAALSGELEHVNSHVTEQEQLAVERLAALEEAGQRAVLLAQEIEAIRTDRLAALAERDEARSELEKSRQEAAALREEVDSARVWLREAQTQVQSLAGELDVVQTALIAEQTRAVRMADKNAILQSDLARTQTIAKTREDERESHRAEVDRLRLELQEHEKARMIERSGLRAELAARDEKVAGVAAEIERAAAETKLLHGHAEALRATLTQQAAAIQDSVARRRRIFPALYGLRQRLSRWRRPDFEGRAWEVEAIRRSKLFSPLWYLKQNPDVVAGEDDPLQHYLAHGEIDKRNPHPLFNTCWYVAQYPEAADAKMTPLTHYITVGVSEGLDPMPLFDTDFYLCQNPDVAAAGTNPLHHYMVYGAYEGRDPHPLFDSSWYLEMNPDVAAAKDNPLQHYIIHGWKEGRDPHPEFDTKWYLEQNPDIATGQDPLEHYVLYGEKEGRHSRSSRSLSLSINAKDINPSTMDAADAALLLASEVISLLFDEVYYLANNPDVAAAGVDPKEHFMEFGWKEGRNPHPLFVSRWYLEKNPDVAAAGENPLIHFILSGAKELRDPSPYFSIKRYLEEYPDAVDLNINPLVHALLHRRGVVPKIALSVAPLLRPKAPDDKFWPLVANRSTIESTKVDVIVPVYRGYDDTLACIYSVLSSQQKTSFELVVINDYGPDADLNGKLERLAEKGLFTYLKNESNLGFVQTVNRGLSLHSDRDVILLNSDAIVYSNWLDRMIAHADSDEKIATITPFSNNATVCSYPVTNRANTFQLEISPEIIDSYAASCNKGSRNELPSGVGFCFYMRRQVINEVGVLDYETFGRGYGEENDFCMRALEAGYKNVLAHDIFVYHTGELSFSETATKARDAAQILLDIKHPDYHARVCQYISADPSRAARARLDSARLAHAVAEKPIVFVSHTWGGGIEQNIRDLTRLFALENIPTVMLRVGSVDRETITLELDRVPEGLFLPNAGEFNATQDEYIIREFLTILQPRLIHVHSTVGLSAKGIVSLFHAIQTSKIPYYYTWHDYAPLCHRNQFVLPNRQYCGEPNVEVCKRCLSLDNEAASDEFDPQERRVIFGEFLRGATKIFVPSAAARMRALRLSGAETVVVKPHPEKFDPTFWVATPPDVVMPLRVAIVGAIGPHKGSDVLYSLLQDASERDLPIEYLLIGHSDRQDLVFFRNFRCTGKYLNDEVALGHLHRYVPHLCLLPSIWPETYCYTLSLAFKAGVPPVVFDLGAPAERIRERGWGWVLPVSMSRYPQQLNDALLDLPIAKMWADRKAPENGAAKLKTDYYTDSVSTGY